MQQLCLQLLLCPRHEQALALKGLLQELDARAQAPGLQGVTALRGCQLIFGSQCSAFQRGSLHHRQASTELDLE